MKELLNRVAIFAVLSALATSCSRNVTGGNPTILLANSNGTARVFEVSVSEINQGITNSFDSLKYHEMLLIRVTNSDWDYLAPKWRPTNGYILYESRPIADIPLDTGVTAPYLATFSIEVQQIGLSAKTKVIVRTLQAEVIDGTEQGMHGGIANHTRKIAAVRKEEETILESLANYLDPGLKRLTNNPALANPTNLAH
jgi:hypothetical protein